MDYKAPMILQKAPEPIEPAEPNSPLSSREWEVMMRLVAGKRISDIAKELQLSIKTVSTYYARIRTKTGIQSVAGLAIQAAKQGLV